MKRDDALTCFYIQQMDKGLEKITELDQFCRKNRDIFRAKLMEVFWKLADQIKEKQQDNEKTAIFCISIVFLRSKFYFGEGRIQISAYDNRFFLDTDPICLELDVGFLSLFIWDLEKELVKDLGDYKKIIVKSDVQKLIQTEYIPHLLGYITELSRYTLRKEGTKCFQEISLTDDFFICVGEYQGDFDEIYVTAQLDRGGIEIGRYFKNHTAAGTAFYCKKYQNISIHNIDLSSINFTKSFFDTVCIEGSKLENCALTKTDWINCKLAENSWKGSHLFEAKFTGSDLTGSDFSGIIAPILPPNILYPTKLSTNGLDFTNTVLDHVTFKGADIRGADFRGAKFQNTNFTNVRLDQAIFDKSACSSVNFTEEQRNVITVKE